MIASDLALIALCLLGGAFLEGIETGVISIHRVRLRHLVEQNDAAARRLQFFMDHPDRLLGTTLVGVNLFVTGATVLASSLGHRLVPRWGELLAGGLMTVLVLIFCQYLPKAWFQSDPLRRCRAFVVPLQAFHVVLSPLSSFLNWLTHWFIPRAMTAEESHPSVVTKDEIDLLAKEGEEHGVLTPKQRIMIRRVFELSSKTARHIMTPRSRITFVRHSATVDEFVSAAQACGFSRLPVYDEGKQSFQGIVSLFDVLSGYPENRALTMADFMRPPLLIPEETILTEVFPRLRLSRRLMCMVVDNQMQVTGLITTDDVLREIVGKL